MRLFRSNIFKQWGIWFLGTFFSAIAGIVLTKYVDNQFSGIIIFGLILVFVLLLAFISYKESDAFNLLNVIKNEDKKCNWEGIIRIAFPLSVPLWLSKNYELRVKLGTHIRRACDNLIGLKKQQIIIDDTYVPVKTILSKTLIDDLGWTLYKVKNKRIGEVIKNIKSGIDLASETKNINIVFKGYQHLSGISCDRGEYTNMDNYHSKMLEFIKNDEFRNAMYKFALARNELIRLKKMLNDFYENEKNEKTKKILEDIQFAGNYFKTNNPIECTKTFCIEADVYLIKTTYEKMNTAENLNQAKNLLQEGLKICKEYQCRENFIQVLLKLIEIDQKRLDLLNLKEEEKLETIKDINNNIENVRAEIKNSDDEYLQISQIKQILKTVNKRYSTPKINL